MNILEWWNVFPSQLVRSYFFRIKWVKKTLTQSLGGDLLAKRAEKMVKLAKLQLSFALHQLPQTTETNSEGGDWFLIATEGQKRKKGGKSVEQ
jgi:hypothetical protein